MILILFSFNCVLGTPRGQRSVDLTRELENIGKISAQNTDSCPYSKNNRCSMKRGTLFSRSKCEWLEYYEECDIDGSDKCHGYFESLKIFENLVDWETCDDSVIYAIRNIFPGVKLEFEEGRPGRARSCLPTVWSGPETCDPVLKKGFLDYFHRFILRIDTTSVLNKLNLISVYNEKMFHRIDRSLNGFSEVLVNKHGEAVGAVLTVNKSCAQYYDLKTGEVKHFNRFTDAVCRNWM